MKTFSETSMILSVRYPALLCFWRTAGGGQLSVWCDLPSCNQTMSKLLSRRSMFSLLLCYIKGSPIAVLVLAWCFLIVLGQTQRQRDLTQQCEDIKWGFIMLDRLREESKDVFPLKLPNLGLNLVPCEVRASGSLKLKFSELQGRSWPCLCKRSQVMQ